MKQHISKLYFSEIQAERKKDTIGQSGMEDETKTIP